MNDGAPPAQPSYACHAGSGWRDLQDRMPMTHGRGATIATTAAHIAAALAIVSALAFGLSLLERRLEDRGLARATIHRALGIRTAHAARDAAPLLIRSHPMPLALTAGETAALTLGFKNAADWPWVKGTGSVVVLERATPNGPSRFLADDWLDTMRASLQEEDRVAPGALSLFTAHVRAPVDPGTYTDRFVLRTLDGRVLEGSETEVTIVSVLGPASPVALASSADLAVFASPAAADARGTDGTVDPLFVAETIRYPAAPNIRIGIDYFEPSSGAWNPHVITSTVAFRVTEESGDEVVVIPAGDRIGVDYRPSDATYHVKHGTNWYTVDEPVRITSSDPAVPLRITSYDDKLKWETNEIDDEFLGTLEVRYVSHTERLWVIEEVNLEDYVRGLVESTDSAPMEFHKAQAVAARTFALYHLERGGKYPKGQFILRNDARDQVYRGARAARRRPNYVAAADATRGIVVTYHGDAVETPYYAQSSGQTKSWAQKWGGTERAWLTSVSDPACAGKREIGHGVGLAQRCAMTLANQGWVWQSLLHHYYTGVELRKIFD